MNAAQPVTSELHACPLHAASCVVHAACQRCLRTSLLQWLNRFNPYTYILYALAIDQLGQNEQELITPNGQVITVKAFMKEYFGYEYSFRWCALLPAPPPVALVQGHPHRPGFLRRQQQQ